MVAFCQKWILYGYFMGDLCEMIICYGNCRSILWVSFYIWLHPEPNFWSILEHFYSILRSFVDILWVSFAANHLKSDGSFTQLSQNLSYRYEIPKTLLMRFMSRHLPAPAKSSQLNRTAGGYCYTPALRLLLHLLPDIRSPPRDKHGKSGTITLRP